jgi:hypothetical protein
MWTAAPIDNFVLDRCQGLANSAAIIRHELRRQSPRPGAAVTPSNTRQYVGLADPSSAGRVAAVLLLPTAFDEEDAAGVSLAVDPFGRMGWDLNRDNILEYWSHEVTQRRKSLESSHAR